MIDSKRLLSVRILQQILDQKGSLNSLISRFAADQSPEDRAFIQALCFGVCRDFHRLDFICRDVMSKALRRKDNDIRALILCGLYQLFSMRVPPHAAVHETVATVKALKKPWAKDLVNAVLREAQRREESFITAIKTDFSLQYSHPQWMIDAFKRDWPKHYQQILAANNEQAPMTLRVDLNQVSRDDYLASLATAGLKARSGRICDTAVVLAQPVAVTEVPGFTDGIVSVQDEASQLAATLLDPRADQKVLDACAAPGGKSCAILQTAPGVALTALDNEPSRLERVRENLERIDAKAKLLCADVRDVSAWSDGDSSFDRILLDVPCSGTGVIRRHPDIKLLRSADSIAALTALQSEILEAVWPLLKPDGKLLYSTCSILSAENSDQIASFMNKTSNARELPLPSDWGQASDHGRQLLPGAENHDGFYYALLTKC